MSMFCPVCKTMLVRKGGFFECPRCGEKVPVEDVNLETIISLPEDKKEIPVIDRDVMMDFATYNSVCPKCGYNKAYIINQGVTRGDEDERVLYKCPRCGYTYVPSSTKVL